MSTSRVKVVIVCIVGNKILKVHPFLPPPSTTTTTTTTTTATHTTTSATITITTTTATTTITITYTTTTTIPVTSIIHIILIIHIYQEPGAINFRRAITLAAKWHYKEKLVTLIYGTPFATCNNVQAICLTYPVLIYGHYYHNWVQNLTEKCCESQPGGCYYYQ